MSDPKPKPISEGQLRVMKMLVRPFSIFNAWVYRSTGGRWLGKFGGCDVCVVTMKGAKTGAIREIPLMYVPWKDGVILVASLGGAPRHPTWYYNLVAHPDIEVLVRNDSLKLRARRASAEEKAEVWPICCDAYPDYAQYQRRTDRDIPVFLCEPRS